MSSLKFVEALKGPSLQATHGVLVCVITVIVLNQIQLDVRTEGAKSCLRKDSALT